MFMYNNNNIIGVLLFFFYKFIFTYNITMYLKINFSRLRLIKKIIISQPSPNLKV